MSKPGHVEVYPHFLLKKEAGSNGCTIIHRLIMPLLATPGAYV